MTVRTAAHAPKARKSCGFAREVERLEDAGRRKEAAAAKATGQTLEGPRQSGDCL